MKQSLINFKTATMAGILLLFCLVFVPAAVLAEADQLTSLEQIELLISQGPEVLAASAAIARDESLAALARQRAGAKYFSGITYGYSNEPIFDTSEDKSSYNKLSLTGGLNFPMLGTWQKGEIAELETETATMKSRHLSHMLLLNNLAAVRKAYTTLWIEQQKADVCKRFLSTEADTLHILQARQVQGLLLPADRLNLLAVYLDAKRDLAASKLRQTQALRTINLATGRNWNMVERLKAPSFPNIEGKKIDLTSHPQVAFQNQLVAQYEKILEKKKRIDRDGNLTVGLTAARDFPGSTGSGAYIAFSMAEPVRKTSKDQAVLAAAEELDRARNEQKVICLQLEGQAEEAMATAAYAAADVNASAARLVVMTESIREKMLRRMVLPGDSFEQLQNSKSQYYRAALEMLDNEELFLHSAIDIISYVYPSGLEPRFGQRLSPIHENDAVRKKLLAPSWLDSKHLQDDLSEPLDFSDIPKLNFPDVLSGSVEKMKAAVYVWNAQPFLQSDTRTAALDDIVAAGFSRVLISFTSQQISDLLSSAGRNELDNLLATAKVKGVRMDILLGEPTWAEADQREELLTLIKQMQRFDFDGIHLDIEPDSLPGGPVRREKLFEGLADTIKAVKNVTGLPLSISIHPRYLENDLGVLARQQLSPLGLEEVVVMIYSDNPYATAQRMSAIITSNPNISFSLAQSVETNIPLDESYADSTPQAFKDAMQVLADELAIYGIKGIFIQSWEDYKKGITK